ncbi:PREDICTED: RING finger protein 145-like isoform X1 [Wasmannia auropunctata]|uniref:RING finger protein 145-like isoform X1 n=1 Tax=Wasmannia auropunctata TaxID=64793 RepID=UPI0005EE9E5D|nr:PREDICTED: RING finger protein 145-like isoform X1 [Wasmannia auropunctata]XP_011688610.1 PREDICTED: RING finger protein 145-like isoform X1 [Wasmannia auropunctata]
MTAEQQLDLSRSFKCCAGFTGEEYTAITYESICNCGICFDKVKDAVTTKCGHLFCWPHLHEWLKTNQVCPKCRTPLNRKDYFAFHECGDIEHEDRNDFPPRPTFQGLEDVEIDVEHVEHENWSTEANLSDVEHEDWSTEANLNDIEHEDRHNNVMAWLMANQSSEPAEAYLSDAEHEDRHNESSPRSATFTFFLTAVLIVIATIVVICVIVITKSSDYFILESGENEKRNKKKRINIERVE